VKVSIKESHSDLVALSGKREQRVSKSISISCSVVSSLTKFSAIATMFKHWAHELLSSTFFKGRIGFLISLDDELLHKPIPVHATSGDSSARMY